MSLQNLRDFVNNFFGKKSPYDIDPYATFEFRFLEIDDHYVSQLEGYYNTDLHKFIKSINDAELSTNQNSIELPAMRYTLHRLMPSMSSNNTLSVSWLNTTEPFIEGVIIPWMQDVTINGIFPIPKCNVEITLQHTNKSITYRYYGVRPVEATLFKMTNEANTEFYRKIDFTFDYFWCGALPVQQIVRAYATPTSTWDDPRADADVVPIPIDEQATVITSTPPTVTQMTKDAVENILTGPERMLQTPSEDTPVVIGPVKDPQGSAIYRSQIDYVAGRDMY